MALFVEFIIGDYKYYAYDTVNNYVCPQVVDNTKTSYEDMPDTVEYEGITYTIKMLSNLMPSSGCFYNCTNLITAPKLPNTAVNLKYCFYGCSSLITTPQIPDGVMYMEYCFYNCISLTCFPIVPDLVSKMDYCFYGCTSLIGEIQVYNNPSTFTDIFTNINNEISVIVKNPSALSTWQTIADDYSNIVINVDFTILSIDTVNNNAIIGNKTTIEDSDITDTIEFESKTFLRRGFHIKPSIVLSDLITELNWEL